MFIFPELYFHRVELVVLSILHFKHSAKCAISQEFGDLIFPIEVLLTDFIVIVPSFGFLRGRR
jgi:hypothetical protein